MNALTEVDVLVEKALCAARNLPDTEGKIYLLTLLVEAENTVEAMQVHYCSSPKDQ